jgi:hypothetical protein
MWIRNEVKRTVRPGSTLLGRLYEKLGVVPDYGPRVGPVSDGRNICRWHKRGQRKPVEHVVQLKTGWVGLCCQHYQMYQGLKKLGETRSAQA